MKSAAKIKRPPLRYRGGKWRLAEWIISFFPPHELYCEPFAGGASVLFRKPASTLEVINDMDGDVVAFFRCLRNRPDELREALRLTPYSREELRLANKQVEEATDVEMERARRLYVRCQMGRGSSSRIAGFRMQRTKYGWGVNKPREFLENGFLDAAAERLTHVQLENLPALELIPRADGPKALFYVDPPYLAATRSGKLYNCEMMGEEEHQELSEQLHSVKGMVVLSGGDSGFYRELYADWKLEMLVARGEMNKTYTECLWLNSAAQNAQRQMTFSEV